ncbi:uncharacterized protein LOC132603431 isoform X3 [Lycium barbarum]|uniref:uncharacterized protein LOC132603431 isoform X3 n=1 Tax=Lycium barbarum TaxID=112863 RepID=UPI00293E1D27|nr:uncharacterized protein LOC132603431 isoform X3 [Lycium barbarum]
MKLPLLQHRQLESTYHPEIKRTKLLDEKEEGFRKWNRSRWSNILSVRGTTVCFTIDIAVSETIQDNKNCSSHSEPRVYRKQTLYTTKAENPHLSCIVPLILLVKVGSVTCG